MPAAKCAICGKTAYPLESFNAIEKTYHKACFKCDVCKLTLNLTNYKGLEGKIFCKLHVPQAKATAVIDSVAMKHAQAAPHKGAEGLGTVQKGTGEKPNVGLDTVATQHALNAPRRTAESLGTVLKGSGGKPQYQVFGADGSITVQDEKPADGVQYEEIPAEQVEEQQPAEEAPAEEPQEQPEEVPAEQPQ
eukprot:TRINITY_DN1925_c0_g1_i2.p1 TRINITY_DN1925_c0_g1~~TRINITY_DN1925_c0_g1_i2.p1  ORF type:complete len:191 (+),score=68.84 TRINITY_DN1925_c0_g1_i2:82-654(+)